MPRQPLIVGKIENAAIEENPVDEKHGGAPPGARPQVESLQGELEFLFGYSPVKLARDGRGLAR